jgi:L-iditol 2-dehydrogenase
MHLHAPREADPHGFHPPASGTALAAERRFIETAKQSKRKTQPPRRNPPAQSRFLRDNRIACLRQPCSGPTHSDLRPFAISARNRNDTLYASPLSKTNHNPGLHEETLLRYSRQMKALLLSEYKNISYTSVDDPVIGSDDVLVRVKACGICGSDIHGYDGSTGRRVPPLIMGHEAAGVIAEVGANVRGLQLGQRVSFDSTVSCGNCRFCRSGQINLCDNRQVLGVSCGEYRRHGAFAEFVSVPARIVYPLPDTLGFTEAAMLEAVSIGVHAVSLTPVTLNDTAVIIGTGMIGLLTLQAARLAGFRSIIAVDTDNSRLALAQELGANFAFNAKETDIPEAVRSVTAGFGADAALECVGSNATVLSAINSVRKGGAVTLVGNLSPRTELPLQTVVTRQLRIQGSCASSGEIPACIDLLARNDIRVDKIISAVVPMSEGPAWFDRLHKGAPGLMKVILSPEEAL